MKYFLFILTSVLFYSDPSGMDLQDDISQQESDSLKLVRGPYLQSLTQSSIIIRWRTNIPTKSRVIYGNSPEDLSQTIEYPNDTTEHLIQLSGLKPDTKYYYGVGNSDHLLSKPDSSFYFITAPSLPSEKTVRIWAIGDFGTADSIARSVKNAYLKYMENRHTDVWLMLGDIAYTHGTDEQFQSALFDHMYDELLKNTVFWPTPGNHDMGNADSETKSGPYYDIFSLPVNGEAGGIPSGTEAYYAFDYANIHFISMDSDDTPLDKDGDMITWLESDLKADKSKWTIVFFHHPPYTKGTYDSDSYTESGGKMTHIRENIVPILDKYGVDLVLSGHSHVYERSYLIANHYGLSRTFTTKTMIINSEGKKKRHPTSYLKTEHGIGTIYVVCGVSGSRPTGGHFRHPTMAYSSDQYRGSMVIEINDNKLYAVFLDTQGKVRDWFRIEKEEKSLPEIPVLGGDN